MRQYPFNAVQFLRDYKIQHWTEGKNVSPGWVNTQCVFCNDSSNHLGWNMTSGYVNCWKCGVHPLNTAISKLLKIPYSRVDEIIREYEELSTKFVQQKKVASAKAVEIPGGELSKFHQKYLKKRGFDPVFIAEKYGITGTGPGEEWNGRNYELRIIIPIILNGQVVSFQGRDITDKQTERYKGCPVEMSVINYKHILYNLDNVAGDKVVVVEGITDVWKMGDGTVCSFGTSMTTAQIRLLSDNFNSIYFLFDSEHEAQEKAREYGRQLSSMGKDVEIFSLEGNQDPGDLPYHQINEIKKELGI